MIFWSNFFLVWSASNRTSKSDARLCVWITSIPYCFSIDSIWKELLTVSRCKVQLFLTAESKVSHVPVFSKYLPHVLLTDENQLRSMCYLFQLNCHHQCLVLRRRVQERHWLHLLGVPRAPFMQHDL